MGVNPVTLALSTLDPPKVSLDVETTIQVVPQGPPATQDVIRYDSILHPDGPTLVPPLSTSYLGFSDPGTILFGTAFFDFP